MGFGAKSFQQRETGFTLLETVVALTVILAAVLGPVSLVTRGLFTFSLAKNRIIAVNLAQEGLELVRLIRENNVACDDINGSVQRQWNQDPRGGLMTLLRVGADANDFRDAAVCGNSTIAFPHMSSSCSERIRFVPSVDLPNGGTYGYAGSEVTIFSRCIDIASGVNIASPTAGIPHADQMDVVSTVSWSEHGAPYTAVVRERLYNWR